MAIVKQGISDWPGSDGGVTSHSNSRLSASKRPWGADGGYLLLITLSV